MKIYLDSSAIVKRYVSEPGTSAVDFLFDRCWAGELVIATSIWNIGEVLGVFDTKRRRGWLTEKEFRRALGNFVEETRRLLRLKVLEVFPVMTPMLTETWSLILNEHVYEADALQIRTAIYSGSNVFLSADRELVDLASKYGIKAINIEKEAEIKELFE